MKKFIGSFFVLILVILTSLTAVPWNNLAQWGLSFTILTNYEIYIKAGIFALAILIGLIYLLLANSEYNEYEHVSVNTSRTAFLPIYLFSIAIVAYGSALNYYIYLLNTNTTNLLIVAFFGFVLVNLIIFGHLLGSNFRKTTNGGRIAIFIFNFEFAAVFSGITYWFYLYKLTNYSGFNSYYFAGAAGVGIILYIVHLFFSPKSSDDLEDNIAELEKDAFNPVYQDKKNKRKRHQVVTPTKNSNKTMIVSNSQTIVSAENNIDPTNMIYEDVEVDPEFVKTNNSVSSPNSIEYYIEKPKMFKPVEPTFDQLVAYVRELPQVVTKIDDNKITFYLDRKPFLVLMNFGNYYRMAFKYDLEKGIRLIIKYPTISKNKSTKDELWFKANNYGDIPKDIIYQIVKYSYDSVNL